MKLERADGAGEGVDLIPRGADSRSERVDWRSESLRAKGPGERTHVKTNAMDEKTKVSQLHRTFVFFGAVA